MKVHQLSGNRPLNPLERGDCKTGNKGEAAHDERPLTHLKAAAEDFPNWVPANVVCLSTVVEPHLQFAVLTGSRTELPVVEGDLVRECSCLPTVHPRGGYGNPIDCATF